MKDIDLTTAEVLTLEELLWMYDHHVTKVSGAGSIETPSGIIEWDKDYNVLIRIWDKGGEA